MITAPTLAYRFMNTTNIASSVLHASCHSRPGICRLLKCLKQLSQVSRQSTRGKQLRHYGIKATSDYDDDRATISSYIKKSIKKIIFPHSAKKGLEQLITPAVRTSMYRANNAIRIDRSHVALILRARRHRLEYENTGFSGFQSLRQSIQLQLAAPLDVSGSRGIIERKSTISVLAVSICSPVSSAIGPQTSMERVDSTKNSAFSGV